MMNCADTIYACQDKRDDVKAGVKSTALLFGAHVKKILAVFAMSFVTCLAVAGALNNQGVPYLLSPLGERPPILQCNFEILTSTTRRAASMRYVTHTHTF